MTENQFEFHTEWSDGHVHAAGFTTAWPPNKAIIGSSFYPGMDLDLNGKNEENGGPTFSAINARSYHPGGVNTLLGDGSVRFVKSTHRRHGLARDGHGRRRRSHFRRCVLTLVLRLGTGTQLALGGLGPRHLPARSTGKRLRAR